MHLVCTLHAPGANPCALARTRMKCLTAELAQRRLNIASCSPWRSSVDRDAHFRRRRRSTFLLLMPTFLTAFFTAPADRGAAFCPHLELHSGRRPRETDPACGRARLAFCFFAMVSLHGIMPPIAGSSWGRSTGTKTRSKRSATAVVGARRARSVIVRTVILCLASPTTFVAGVKNKD
jgi:hypothetical protein